MKTNVRFLIFFLYTIKLTILELLSQTIIKFEPFEIANILSVKHLNTTNIALIDTKFSNHNIKILKKRHTQQQFSNVNNLLQQRIYGNVVPQ
ncbi:hypothetical protein LOAG_15785, partial [Loa loa]